MNYISDYLPEDIKNTLFAKEKKDKKENLQFRESSQIEIERKPCGCMTNITDMIKETPSS